MKYLKENVKKYLTQRTVNIVTLAGVGLLAVSALSSNSSTRPNNGFSSRKLWVEHEEQTNANRFLEHEFARLRHCTDAKLRGFEFHPSAPSSWICEDIVPSYREQVSE